MSNPSPPAPRRWLDPLDRFSEALFGLVMVLTFTSSVSAVQGGREEIREILVGAVSCNVAWGIVDGVMYLLARRTERTREVRDLRAVRAAPDAAAARAVLAETVPAFVADALGPEQVEAVRRNARALPEPGQPAGLTLADWMGAVSVFVWVIFVAVPVVLPFVLMDEALPALRVSNAVAIVMLFGAGYGVARASGGRPVRTGLAMVAVGVALVAVTVALGG